MNRGYRLHVGGEKMTVWEETWLGRKLFFDICMESGRQDLGLNFFFFFFNFPVASYALGDRYHPRCRICGLCAELENLKVLLVKCQIPVLTYKCVFCLKSQLAEWSPVGYLTDAKVWIPLEIPGLFVSVIWISSHLVLLAIKISCLADEVRSFPKWTN